MVTIDFSTILYDIAQQVAQLANSTIHEYEDEARQDVEQFLKQNKDNIESWTDLLNEARITKAEYEYFVLGLNDVAQLKILKQAGLAEIRTSQFLGAVLNVIITVVFKVIFAAI